MSPVQGIGERLREARMRRSVEIAQVEAAIKIRAKYLRALENEDFELLPGPTFVKTFLRTYAEYLGLDPHLLVEEYRAGFEPHEAEPQAFAPPAPRRERERRAPRPAPSPATAGFVVVALVLMIFAILGLTGGSEKPTPAHQVRQPHPPAPPARKQTHPRPAPPTSVVLHIAPAAPTYVCVDHGRGTRRTFEGIISSPRTFRGKHLRINLGVASTRLTVNRKRLVIPPSGRPVGYDLTPNRTAPLAPLLRPCVA
ncbi:MAG: hypothetical protein NVSMB25_09790 [Thermoleophilaceae bacterium]